MVLSELTKTKTVACCFPFFFFFSFFLRLYILFSTHHAGGRGIKILNFVVRHADFCGLFLVDLCTGEVDPHITS